MGWNDLQGISSMDIVRLLQPLQEPTRLDARNWQEYLDHSHSTVWTHVQKVYARFVRRQCLQQPAVPSSVPGFEALDYQRLSRRSFQVGGSGEE